MDAVRRDIIARLEREILPLQGFKVLSTDNNISIGFAPIENAFPNATFPLGCTHEFLNTSEEDTAATNGFVVALLSKLMHLDGAALWISSSRTLFPGALKAYNLDPDKMIFVDLKKEKDVLYAVGEALKCNRLSAVVGEIKQISFKESRRLQLAAEQSRVTGFLVHHQPNILNTITCISRWRITSLPSQIADDMPGVGFPRWKVELLKVRNGRPGSWELEWLWDHFEQIKRNIFFIQQEEKRKAG